jgi:hypothetical protein
VGIASVVVKGPPLVVERLTLYLVAPVLAVQVREIWALPPVAWRLAGVGGAVCGAAGVAETSFEFALSPVEFAAETS